MEYYKNSSAAETKSSLNAQIVRVYGWMFLGLIVTGFAALFTIQTSLANLVTNRFSFIFLIIAEFGLVFFLSSRAMKMEYTTAAASFMVYSILNGITLSFIFYAYTLGSIAFVFFITASFFGFMSVYGLITKTDLTSFRSLFMMGLFGVIIASIVNIFLNSSALNWMISFVGVAVFLGLTAYDSQKIKDIHHSYAGTVREKNVAIVGALALYLDFINLFFFILRLLGRRK
jgi:uncharacterized protein